MIHVDTLHFFYLFDAVKLHTMYSFSSFYLSFINFSYIVQFLSRDYFSTFFLGFPIRDQTCLITPS